MRNLLVVLVLVIGLLTSVATAATLAIAPRFNCRFSVDVQLPVGVQVAALPNVVLRDGLVRLTCRRGCGRRWPGRSAMGRLHFDECERLNRRD